MAWEGQQAASGTWKEQGDPALKGAFQSDAFQVDTFQVGSDIEVTYSEQQAASGTYVAQGGAS